MHCWRFTQNETNTYTYTYTYKRIYQGPDLNELEAGDSHICGLVSGTGELVCWQWRRLDTGAYINVFKKIAIGGDFLCGLSEFGNIKCLQEENRTSSIVGHEPRGNYSVIGAGFNHSCAISQNGSLICWGENVGEYPKEGEFTSLALGDARSCAMRVNGTLICWGESNFNLPQNLKDTSFIAIESKSRIFCGILSSNYSLYCWGNEFFETNFGLFDNVVPGGCVSSCPCSRPLPGYGTYCSGKMMICEPCTPLVTQAAGPGIQVPPPQFPAKSGDWSNKMVAFLVMGCVGSTSLMLVVCFLFFKFCKLRKCQVHDSGPLDEEGRLSPNPISVLGKRLSKLVSVNSGCGQLEEFPLQSLNQHTNNFSEDHKIGTGSFGSVYLATLADGRRVAIKRAEASSSTSNNHNINEEEDKDSAFMNELEFLSRLNHKNLVRLLGYCEDSNERILVYEYMCNDTLHDHIHNCHRSGSLGQTASWVGRLKIALDAARGIEYLHVYANPPIIHRDIKSSNILLDATWTAKVSDFGLSIFGPRDGVLHLSVPAAGTMGYLDPEYYRTQQLTMKSDVYSFGVVLLELLTGKRAIHNNENGVPRNVIDYVMPYIAQDEIHRFLDQNIAPPTPFEIEGVAHVGYIAASCVELQGRDRPTMTEVVHNLEKALKSCLAPPVMLSRSSTESSG